MAKEVYQFSLDEEQNFPFCCIGINLSNIVIRTLRQSKHRMNIRKIINEKQMNSSSDRYTVELIGKLFTVLFFNFYSKWKQNGYTIENTQQVLHDLEQMLNNRPQSLFDELNNYYRNNETRSTIINENLIWNEKKLINNDEQSRLKWNFLLFFNQWNRMSDTDRWRIFVIVTNIVNRNSFRMTKQEIAIRDKLSRFHFSVENDWEIWPRLIFM